MTETFFQTSNHRDRFVHAIEAIHKVDGAKYDPEYAAALYLLTSSPVLWSKSQSYVTRHGINFDELLHEIDLSGGQSVLVLLAANLFNNTQHVDPLEFLRLDSGNFYVALNAIKIRRNGLSVEEVANQWTPSTVFCSACGEPVNGTYEHKENGVNKKYCSGCYMSQFD